MRKRSWISLGLAMILAGILMFTNISCGGGTESPAEPNRVAVNTEAPPPVVS